MVNEECINNENDCHVPPVNKKLWIVEFEIAGGKSKGCAVVKASNPNMAYQLLKSEGTYNSTPDSYKVIRIEEINSSPLSMLLCEQIV